MTLKRLLTLALATAGAALALAAPASAQNACLLIGEYVFSSAVNTPGPLHANGVLTFVPPGPPGSQQCIGGVPGTVTVNSELVKFSTAYIVSGVALVIPIPGGGVTTGFVALIEGNLGKGIVYSGVAEGGLSFSGTALRVSQ